MVRSFSAALSSARVVYRRLTAADVQMSFPIEAADARVGSAGTLPKLKGFVERVQARPAHKRALERGGPQTFLK